MTLKNFCALNTLAQNEKARGKYSQIIYLTRINIKNVYNLTTTTTLNNLI